jgi:hypothetical protein
MRGRGTRTGPRDTDAGRILSVNAPRTPVHHARSGDAECLCVRLTTLGSGLRRNDEDRCGQRFRSPRHPSNRTQAARARPCHPIRVRGLSGAGGGHCPLPRDRSFCYENQ